MVNEPLPPFEGLMNQGSGLLPRLQQTLKIAKRPEFYILWGPGKA